MSEYTPVRVENHASAGCVSKSASIVARATRQEMVLRRDKILPYIVSAVCGEFGVTQDELFGDSRIRPIMLPRKAAWWLLRYHPDAVISFPEISKPFNRDHTTVLAGIRTFGWMLDRPAFDDIRFFTQRACNRISFHGFTPMTVG